MVLGFGETKSARPARPDDIPALIAKKDYARAILVIKKKLEANRHDSRLRLQLGDLLVLTGKTKEAVAILTPLADEFAREGFAAKAISVFKKIQKIDPGQRGVDEKLASLIQDKQRVATVAAPPAASVLEFGMEEIGLEAEEAELEPEAARASEPSPTPVAQAPLPAPVEDRDLIDETAEDELPLELQLEPEAPVPYVEPQIQVEPE